MQLSAPIAHQPVRVAIFRHGSARSVPTARNNRVADDFYQRVRDLVPRFFETRRTSMPAFAHQHSVLDLGHRRPAFNCLSEKLRQFRSVLYGEQSTRWANTRHAPPRVEMNGQTLW